MWKIYKIGLWSTYMESVENNIFEIWRAVASYKSRDECPLQMLKSFQKLWSTSTQKELPYLWTPSHRHKYKVRIAQIKIERYTQTQIGAALIFLFYFFIWCCQSKKPAFNICKLVTQCVHLCKIKNVNDQLLIELKSEK